MPLSMLSSYRSALYRHHVFVFVFASSICSPLLPPPLPSIHSGNIQRLTPENPIDSMRTSLPLNHYGKSFESLWRMNQLAAGISVLPRRIVHTALVVYCSMDGWRYAFGSGSAYRTHCTHRIPLRCWLRYALVFARHFAWICTAGSIDVASRPLYIVAMRVCLACSALQCRLVRYNGIDFVPSTWIFAKSLGDHASSIWMYLR